MTQAPDPPFWERTHLGTGTHRWHQLRQIDRGAPGISQLADTQRRGSGRGVGSVQSCRRQIVRSQDELQYLHRRAISDVQGHTALQIRVGHEPEVRNVAKDADHAAA